MKRRTLVAYGLTAPLITACHTQRSFLLGWKEQVQVADGVIVIASVKYTYERLGPVLNFERYTPSILRATEFSFASDAPAINFQKFLPKHRVNALRWMDNKWYLVLEKRGADVILQTPNGPAELFGDALDETGHKCFRLDTNELISVPIDFFSDDLLAPNILMGTAGAGVLSAFDGTTVTLSQKSQYLSKFPLDPTELRIRSRHDSIKNQKQGRSNG